MVPACLGLLSTVGKVAPAAAAKNDRKFNRSKQHSGTAALHWEHFANYKFLVTVLYLFRSLGLVIGFYTTSQTVWVGGGANSNTVHSTQAKKLEVLCQNIFMD